MSAGAVRTDHLKVGGRVLRAGDRVKITGMRGLWKIKYVEVFPADPDRSAEWTVVGGPRAQFRTVLTDQIGTRKAMAGRDL